MSYLGSKNASGAYQTIISQMPPHDTYIETHLGGGAIMQRKAAAIRSIGIDLDKDVLTRFECDYEVDLRHGDAIDFLKSFDFATAGRTLIYVDPPYLLKTRTSRNRYKFEYSDDDHNKLINTLRSVPAKVILSGYDSDLYNDLLADWHALTFQVMTRGGPRTEKLWMNFEVDTTHWCTFAGKNFTDRQRIKRKAKRWADSYHALPIAEQQAILAQLLQAHQQG